MPCLAIVLSFPMTPVVNRGGSSSASLNRIWEETPCQCETIETNNDWLHWILSQILQSGGSETSPCDEIPTTPQKSGARNRYLLVTVKSRWLFSLSTFTRHLSRRVEQSQAQPQLELSSLPVIQIYVQLQEPLAMCTSRWYLLHWA